MVEVRVGSNHSVLWAEGTWSMNTIASYLGQEISGAGYLQSETISSGLTDTGIEASYPGTGRFRSCLKQNATAYKKVNVDETYSGKFSIKRNAHLGGFARYDVPCLYAPKTDTAITWTTYIRYDIDILNDGNSALGPVYVRDTFPEATDYLRAHNDKWITACSYSAIQYSWLACYQSKVSLAKDARIDPNDSLVVWYRLDAKVSGHLPEGVSLLNSSLLTENDPYYLSWVISSIKPGQTKYIVYSAQAPGKGRYVNNVRIEATAIDESEITEANADIAMGLGGSASLAYSGWQPPGWSMDLSENTCSGGASESAVSAERSAGNGSRAGGSCPI